MRKTAIVIGAGPAGLSAAECLAQAGVKTHIYERMASPARKFLLAGRGGLNLTHSEEFSKFIERYGDAAHRLTPFLENFGPEQLRNWCAGLGQETFVGSSGRVFPNSFKASPLLRAWLRRLADLDVQFHLRRRFDRFEHRIALFEVPNGYETARADVYVMALGGASWPKLGADGSWVEPLKSIGLNSTTLRPANSGFLIDWSQELVDRFEGQPVKNIRLCLDGNCARGECVITRQGLEGGVVYAFSHEVGRLLRAGQIPDVRIDLRPDLSVETLATRLARSRGGSSLANFLRKAAKLDPVSISLCRECGALPSNAIDLARLIKSLPLKVRNISGLERAISTAGGIIWDALDDKLMAKSFPGLFIAGEMIDWEAPTGGYLITACMSTGRAAGAAAARWVRDLESR